MWFFLRPPRETMLMKVSYRSLVEPKRVINSRRRNFAFCATLLYLGGFNSVFAKFKNDPT